jgi:hypothetical protein
MNARERIKATVAALEELAATDAIETLLTDAEWARSTALGKAYYAVKNFDFPPFPDVDYLNGNADRAFAQGVEFAQECILRKIQVLRDKSD